MFYSIRKITDHVCCTCKAEVAETTVGGKHVCGDCFESVTYRCGKVLTWSPNFDREEIRTPCPQSREGKERAERQAAQRLLWDVDVHHKTADLKVVHELAEVLQKLVKAKEDFLREEDLRLNPRRKFAFHLDYYDDNPDDDGEV